MYHEVTYDELARRRRELVICLIAIAVAVVAIAFTVGGAQAITRAQAAASVRSAVVAAAVQCCAVEGSYPSSLAHLEHDYGLVVNHNDYVIDYEWLGDNIPPSVAVRAR